MFFWQRTKKKGPDPRGLDRLSSSLETNLHWLQTDLFASDETIVYRRIKTSGPKPRDCVLVYADNMVKHEYLSQFVLRPLLKAELPKGLRGEELARYLAEQVIEADSSECITGYSQIGDKIMGGVGVLLVDGCPLGLVVDAQGWAKRTVTEPPSESVVRGPRLGFSEDLGVNISLVRLQIASPNFKTRFVQVGEQTKTRVAILYLDNVTSLDLVDEVQRRIEEITIDAVLDSGYIQEYIRDAPYSPFPTIGHTERPDVAAAKILEGRVAVLVDGSPFALTMPYLLVEAFQANEDYYNHWMVASFHRLIRYISFFITTSTPALYIALISYHPQLIPTNLVVSISAARKNVPFPGIVEVIIMGLIFEILREGGVRLPRPIGQAVSIVGAIVLGEAAVSASLVSAPMIIVVGLTGVAGFVNPWLIDIAVLFRLLFVVLASVLGLYGYVLGVIAVVLLLSSMESFGVPYLSTMTTLVPQDIKDTLLRVPWWQMTLRPRYLASKDRQRLQGRGGRGS